MTCDQESCAICLEPVCTQQIEDTLLDSYTLECGHVLHTRCLCDWCANTSTDPVHQLGAPVCPLCRHVIHREEALRLLSAYDAQMQVRLNMKSTPRVRRVLVSLVCILGTFLSRACRLLL